MLHGFLLLDIEVRADFPGTYFGKFVTWNYFTSTLLCATRRPLLTTS